MNPFIGLLAASSKSGSSGSGGNALATTADDTFKMLTYTRGGNQPQTLDFGMSLVPFEGVSPGGFPSGSNYWQMTAAVLFVNNYYHIIETEIYQDTNTGQSYTWLRVTKTDSNKKLIWTKLFQSTFAGYSFVAQCGAVAPNGDIYVGGGANGPTIYKINSAGTFQWGLRIMEATGNSNVTVMKWLNNYLYAVGSAYISGSMAADRAFILRVNTDGTILDSRVPYHADTAYGNIICDFVLAKDGYIYALMPDYLTADDAQPGVNTGSQCGIVKFDPLNFNSFSFYTLGTNNTYGIQNGDGITELPDGRLFFSNGKDTFTVCNKDGTAAQRMLISGLNVSGSSVNPDIRSVAFTSSKAFFYYTDLNDSGSNNFYMSEVDLSNLSVVQTVRQSYASAPVSQQNFKALDNDRVCYIAQFSRTSGYMQSNARFLSTLVAPDASYPNGVTISTNTGHILTAVGSVIKNPTSRLSMGGALSPSEYTSATALPVVQTPGYPVGSRPSSASDRGIVWFKARDNAGFEHVIADSVIGPNKVAEVATLSQGFYSRGGSVTQFTAAGVSLGSDSWVNGNARYVAYAIKEAAKFFKIVTYVGDGSVSKLIQHGLGSRPGLIMIRALTAANYKGWGGLHLGTLPTDAPINMVGWDSGGGGGQAGTGYVSATDVTDTTFDCAKINNNYGYSSNQFGETYQAYVFGNDLTGSSMIRCGVFYVNGGLTTETLLNWEPQFLMIRKYGEANSPWYIVDRARPWDRILMTQESTAEQADTPSANSGFYCEIHGAGFKVRGSDSCHWCFVAIRGPSRLPVQGNQVYNTVARNGSNDSQVHLINGIGFSPDLLLGFNRTRGFNQSGIVDRVRGSDDFIPAKFISVTQFQQETTDPTGVYSFEPDGFMVGNDYQFYYVNGGAFSYSTQLFKQAPGCFKIQRWTGDMSTGGKTVYPGLGVKFELAIIADTTNGGRFMVAYDFTSSGVVQRIMPWSDTEPVWLNDLTASQSFFQQSDGSLRMSASYVTTTDIQYSVNQQDANYIGYFFASCPGVSKVGRYTGIGASYLVVDCGFTTGVRFVMIRSESGGHWYCFDYARGINNGNPAMAIDSIGIETQSYNVLQSDPQGSFVVNPLDTNLPINSPGVNYLFVAFS